MYLNMYEEISEIAVVISNLFVEFNGMLDQPVLHTGFIVDFV